MSIPQEAAHRSATLNEADFLQPLRQFYDRAKLVLPEIERLDAEALPEPYAALLAHTRDMTPTLERFHHGELHIEVLRREQHADLYYREVVLRLDANERAVEFGANCIHLHRFPPEARWMILQEKLPLGRILQDHQIPHRTQPAAFFRLRADAFIRRALGATEGEWLHGRQARLCAPDGQPLSEVVEILPAHLRRTPAVAALV